jgi:hypothetical protein
MLKLGDVVIPTHPSLLQIALETGSIEECMATESRLAFDPLITDFLGALSKSISSNSDARSFPDLLSVAFSMRPANVIGYQNQIDPSRLRKGKGLVFHITPSNVPLNFVYSYIFSLLSGNANLVRLTSKSFPQIDLFVRILNEVLQLPQYSWIRRATCFIRYEHSKEITDFLSSKCDARVIWGGDQTIREIRSSEIRVGASEVVFPNRYSMSLVNSQEFLRLGDDDQSKLVGRFFTDSFLFDQQGCSSPKLMCWFGDSNVNLSAQELFWKQLDSVASLRYDLQMKNATDKFVDICLALGNGFDINSVMIPSRYITRIKVNSDSDILGKYQGQFGSFLECEINSFESLENFVSSEFQTVTYFGFEIGRLRKEFASLKISGVDRVVPIGQAFDITMDWDGQNFVESLSRIIDFR